MSFFTFTSWFILPTLSRVSSFFTPFSSRKILFLQTLLSSPKVALVVKNLLANLADGRDMGSVHPWVGDIPWRRKWQHSPVFYLGKIPRTEDPRGLQDCRAGNDWSLVSQQRVLESPITLNLIFTHILFFFFFLYFTHCSTLKHGP